MLFNASRYCVSRHVHVCNPNPFLDSVKELNLPNALAIPLPELVLISSLLLTASYAILLLILRMHRTCEHSLEKIHALSTWWEKATQIIQFIFLLLNCFVLIAPVEMLSSTFPQLSPQLTYAWLFILLHQILICLLAFVLTRYVYVAPLLCNTFTLAFLMMQFCDRLVVAPIDKDIFFFILQLIVSGILVYPLPRILARAVDDILSRQYQKDRSVDYHMDGFEVEEENPDSPTK